MIATIAAAMLTFLPTPVAKASIAQYESEYWTKRNIPAVTSEPYCKRRSKMRVVCVTYTRIVEPGRTLHVTTQDSATLEHHGTVIRVIGGKSGLFDEERVLE